MREPRPGNSTIAGFTIVEILVALALGLIIVLTVVQAYVANNRASRFNDAFGIMIEDGRFTLSFLRKAIEMGGYIDPDNPAVPHPDNAGVDGGNNPDSITVYYQGGNGLLDCQGNTVTAAATVADKFEVVGNELHCNYDPSNPDAVVGGIEVIQFLYGLDTSGDRVPNQFLRADQISGAQWAEVVAVEMGLLMRTDNEVANDPDSTTYQVLDGTFGPAGDRRVRKLFTATIALRNRIAE